MVTQARDADAAKPQLRAEVKHPNPAALIQALCAHALEHDLTFATHADGSRIADAGIGTIALDARPHALIVSLAASVPANLYMLREAVLDHLAGISDAAPPRWIGTEVADVGAPPPNFRIMEVADVRPAAPDFLTVRLAGQNLAPFAATGLHFRLALPPDSQQPIVWPHVQSDGRTCWPGGASALHQPVYTITRIDPQAGWLEFDVFIHKGGRTCQWAEGLLTGSDTRQQVGISGPGGGWFPDAKRLLIAGDETALPAMRRILSNRLTGSHAYVVLASYHRAHADALEASTGIAVEWCDRNKGQTAAQFVEARGRVDQQDIFAWFAGEKSDAVRMRALFRTDWGLDRTSSYASAYWSK